MPLQEELNKFLNYTRNIASFEFEKPADDIATDVLSRKRKLFRDAKPHEVRLAALVAGEPILSRIKSNLIYRSTRNSKVENRNEQDIARILAAAKLLNEMCDQTVYSKQIQEREQRFGKYQASISLQSTTLANQMSELSKYSTSQQNDHASTTSSDKLEPSNDISATMERKLENQLKAVRKYETDIQTKQNDHKRLLDETKVQQEIHGQLEELKEKLDNSHVAKSSDDDNPDDVTNDIRHLEKRIEERMAKISQINKKLDSLEDAGYDEILGNRINNGNITSSYTAAPSHEVTAGLQACFAMLNDSESSNDSYKGDTNKLTPLVDELLKLLRVVKKALEGRKQYLQARTVYQRSLNFILAQCNNDNAPQSAISSSNTTTKTTNRSTDISNTIDRLLQTEAPIEDLSSYLHVKKEVEHKIRILLKLLNVPGHEMTRAELITYIRNYGKTEDGSKKEEDNEKSKPLTERFIINDVELAFIRLEGRDLITMVRSKDSSDAIVKLNF